MVEIFIADLDKDAAAGCEQFAAKQKSIAQIREITVQAELPRIAIRLHHLRLAGKIGIVIVAHVALANERLKVAAELSRRTADRHRCIAPARREPSYLSRLFITTNESPRISRFTHGLLCS